MILNIENRRFADVIGGILYMMRKGYVPDPDIRDVDNNNIIFVERKSLPLKYKDRLPNVYLRFPPEPTAREKTILRIDFVKNEGGTVNAPGYLNGTLEIQKYFPHIFARERFRYLSNILDYDQDVLDHFSRVSTSPIIRTSLRCDFPLGEVLKNDEFATDLMVKVGYMEDNIELVQELSLLSRIHTRPSSYTRIAINNFFTASSHDSYLENCSYPDLKDVHEFLDRLIALKRIGKSFNITHSPIKIIRNLNDLFIKFVLCGVTILEASSLSSLRFLPNASLCFLVDFMKKSNMLDRVYSLITKETFKNF